ncbi:hypothetical protein BELL_0124g00120 [Botrytis elliptica]|uniref:CENP-V/GFA domain-containing protein n=1 Tax=Botrytis elliptica TaxID=278938 RepID=A0A4Z1JV57_9HELO|nr:hypothetical protein BELL_0124g00120 [Botrytis elliptica]
MSEITPELKTYNGNCHCGAFKFTIKMPEITTATQCNCSICFKKGYRWGNIAILNYGNDAYGSSFVRRADRMYKDSATTLQREEILVSIYDGLGREPQYVAAKYTGELPSAKFETEKLYTGGCHCGATTIAFKTQAPLPKRHEHIQECNCSICCRLGITVCYPRRDQVSVSGISNMVEYSFGQGYNIFRFCSTCGVTVDIEKDMAAVSRSPKTWELLTPAQRERWPTIHSINLRCFEGVEWDDINIYKANTKAIDPQYVVPE